MTKLIHHGSLQEFVAPEKIKGNKSNWSFGNEYSRDLTKKGLSDEDKRLRRSARKRLTTSDPLANKRQ